jgi:hypothetical protein
MSKRRRFNVRKILSDPDLRRRLMVRTIQATQAREGIETTEEQAQRAYYIVSEASRCAFFKLKSFKANGRSKTDTKEREFLKALHSTDSINRIDVARNDFRTIEGAPLDYQRIGMVAPLFKDYPPIDPTYGYTRSGLNTTEIDRFVRFHWEVGVTKREWVLFAKGGDYSRFYSDWRLVFDWTDNGRDFKAVVADKYGSASRFVKSESDYFKKGITWVQTTVLGINARLLPAVGIFGVASPTFFPKSEEDFDLLLAVMNSHVFNLLAHCVANRNWGATAIGTIPVPSVSVSLRPAIEKCCRSIFSSKTSWDEGSEICTRFRSPWLLCEDIGIEGNLPARLDKLAKFEAAEEGDIQQLYAQLNTEIYKLYGIPDKTRTIIEETLGERPPEILWPQMEGKSVDQKRMEHVWRLLSYLVKRVVDADEDGIVPFEARAEKASLIDRVREELTILFPDHDANKIEVEIINELKTRVTGYRSVASIEQWIEDVYFEFHCSLYKNRPIIWHITSKPGRGPQAFGALCHYHKFDSNRMAKLRGSYLRDAIQTFKREAALAAQEGRTEDRQEWQTKLEEVQELDRKLQLVQEGFFEGKEGGDRDFRILTPWKSPDERPKGWNPDIDDGVAVNIGPLQRAGVLRKEKVV